MSEQPLCRVAWLRATLESATFGDESTTFGDVSRDARGPLGVEFSPKGALSVDFALLGPA